MCDTKVILYQQQACIGSTYRWTLGALRTLRASFSSGTLQVKIGKVKFETNMDTLK